MLHKILLVLCSSLIVFCVTLKVSYYIAIWWTEGFSKTLYQIKADLPISIILVLYTAIAAASLHYSSKGNI